MKTFSCVLTRAILLIVAAIVLPPVPSFSQTTGGIKAGANFLHSDWEMPGFFETYSGISYHVGMYANLALTQRISLQSEIQFNSFKIDYSGEDYTANYLSVPVIFSYSFFNDILNFHAGPQLSFLLSAKPSLLDFAIGDSEFSITMGTGVTLKKFNITLRYGIGITNLASDDARQLYPEASIKNNNLQLSLAYQIFGKG